MEVHVDPLGGWSGDMFVAALLDAMPEHWPAVQEAVAALDLGPDAACRLVDHRDAVLTGRRFLVAAEAPAHHHDHHDHGHAHHDHAHHDHTHHGEAHGHRRWRDIRALIAASHLSPRVKDHATGIFRLLAEAEAEVHGVEVDTVAFHEVGAVDSIVDIVAAAVLIEAAGAARWSAAPLPLGAGRVRTAHGWLPVPAPATALLLRGLPTLDDGVGGERVTPTGAAVARYLLAGRPVPAPRPRRLLRTGTGFGTRTLPGLSNCLRVLVFEADAASPAGTYAHRELAVIGFEVDDQSPEDLGAGIEHIRALPGVHDVVQSVVFGKKGRVATHVQVLAAPEAREAAIAACFAETTTIGLRHHLVQGAALRRRAETVEVEARPLRVKAVRRPDGTVTAKAESGDLAAEPGHAARARLRAAAEAAVLARQGEEP